MASKGSFASEPRRRRSRRVHERSRIALFDVFRESFEERDAQRKMIQSSEGTIAPRSNARRVGVDEATLRDHVRDHLCTLMNTIRLDAVVDLSETPNISRSVLNYGFQDLSDMTRKELVSSEVHKSIKQSLMDHEPRLVGKDIDVVIKTLEGDPQQRLGVHVSADLIADPADIPVDYQADIDAGSGKVILEPGKKQ